MLDPAFLITPPHWCRATSFFSPPPPVGSHNGVVASIVTPRPTLSVCLLLPNCIQRKIPKMLGKPPLPFVCKTDLHRLRDSPSQIVFWPPPCSRFATVVPCVSRSRFKADCRRCAGWRNRVSKQWWAESVVIRTLDRSFIVRSGVPQRPHLVLGLRQLFD